MEGRRIEIQTDGRTGGRKLTILLSSSSFSAGIIIRQYHARAHVHKGPIFIKTRLSLKFEIWSLLKFVFTCRFSAETKMKPFSSFSNVNKQ